MRYQALSEKWVERTGTVTYLAPSGKMIFTVRESITCSSNTWSTNRIFSAYWSPENHQVQAMVWAENKMADKKWQDMNFLLLHKDRDAIKSSWARAGGLRAGGDGVGFSPQKDITTINNVKILGHLQHSMLFSWVVLTCKPLTSPQLGLWTWHPS